MEAISFAARISADGKEEVCATPKRKFDSGQVLGGYVDGLVANWKALTGKCFSWLFHILKDVCSLRVLVLQGIIYIYIYMQPPPPWTLVLLPFGDGKSRISQIYILEISNCGSPKRDNLEPGVLHNVPV